MKPGWPFDTSRRAMTVDDVAEVMLVETRAYSFPWSRGNFIDSLSAGHHGQLLLVAPKNGASPPAVCGYFVALFGVDELHLLNITVAPEWQSRGLGGLLLDDAVALGRLRGLGSVWLEVRASNDRAQALYGRRGFVNRGVRRGYYPAAGRREDAVVMSLGIEPSPTVKAAPSSTSSTAKAGQDGLV